MDIHTLYGLFRNSAGVSTDSRTISPGQIFFALRGDNFDGADYALDVLDKGASLAVVTEGSKAADSGDPRIVAVPDTLGALRSLASMHRQSLRTPEGRRLPVLGLTGTNGKTTTKELIRTALSAGLKVAATRGNLNNDIGVPLSVLSIPEGTQVAVIEMGASHPDDLLPLLEVADPDYGLITNVGRAHLLGFGSFEGVKKAKGRLYDHIAAKGGKVFVNADDDLLVSMTADRGLDTIRYGLRTQGYSVLPASRQEPFLRIDIDGATLSTHLVGSYNAPNVLAALSVARYFGVSREAAMEAIAAYEPSNNRSQMVTTERNTLIVDAYNANPTSMNAALDNFAAFGGRRSALLGSMGELGEDSLSEHVALVRRLEGMSIDDVRLVGGEFRRALESLGMNSAYETSAGDGTAPGKIKWYADSQALAADCTSISDATVLVKGSRSMQMEKCIPAL